MVVPAAFSVAWKLYESGKNQLAAHTTRNMIRRAIYGGTVRIGLRRWYGGPKEWPVDKRFWDATVGDER